MYKTILYFAGGMILGGVAGFFIGKKATEKAANERADKEIEEMRRYHERKRSYDGNQCECSCRKNSDDVQESGESDGRIQQESGNDLSYETSGTHRTDYTSFYKKGGAKTDIIFEKDADPEAEYQDEVGDEFERAAMEVEEQDEERKRNANRPPKIISAEAVKELPPYVIMELLYYYPETDMMIDADDCMVGEGGEYGHLVGTCLEKYGFGDEDNTERVIFVRNFELDTCYEIQKMPGDDPITAAALEGAE